MSDMPQDFEAMKTRLDEIAEEVSAEGISLDEALALYEEAVKLGLAACDVSEADILVPAEVIEGSEEVAVEAVGNAEEVAVEAAGNAGEGSDEIPQVSEPATSEENNL